MNNCSYVNKQIQKYVFLSYNNHKVDVERKRDLTVKKYVHWLAEEQLSFARLMLL